MTTAQILDLIEDALPDLREVLEHLQDQYDVVDQESGEDGPQQAPNAAMRLGMRLETIIDDFETAVQ